MTEPLFPALDAPDSPDAGLDKPDAWDAILDTVIDDATGELSLVVADAPEDKAPDPGQAPEAAPATPATEPPLDKSYQEMRSWTTRVAQENAEVKRKLQEIEQRYAVADTSADFDAFVDRFANALPEDMHELVGDRRRFAGVVAKAADVLADRKVKAIRESVGSLQEGIVGMGRAVEFIAAAGPDLSALMPYVQHVAAEYAKVKPGGSVFNDYSISDVIVTARALRDQAKQPQAQPATTATGQAYSPPPAAAQPRDARPPITPSQRAASSGGVAVTGDDARTIGRALETGPRAFGNNVRSIIDDVIGDALASG